MTSSRKFSSIKQRFPYGIWVLFKLMVLCVEKKKSPGFEPRTFWFRNRRPSTKPLLFVLNLRPSLIINLRVNNMKSKRI